MNLDEIQTDNVVTFACGGTATVRKHDRAGSPWYPIRIKLHGFHPGKAWWIYDASGENGEGTGPAESKCPFDIVSFKGGGGD